jgi:hypothetical protein
LSHYMSDGEKPYMVYTKYGGLGYVAQNAASTKYDNPSQCQSGLVICPVLDPKTVIEQGEYAMMNNDVICCNNGHRINILDKYHTQVSIGIAYDKYSFYMTQNFENNYMNFTKLPSENNGTVTFAGNVKSGLLANIGIFYDLLPTKQIYEQHKNDGFYTLGNEELATVLPQPPKNAYYLPSNETFEVSDKLVQTGNHIDTSFDISPFVTKGGVYTIVAFLQNGTEQFPITSYSITNPSPMVQDGFKSPKVNYACTQSQLDKYGQLQQQLNTLQKQYDVLPKTVALEQEFEQDIKMYSQLQSLQNQTENFKC